MSAKQFANGVVVIHTHIWQKSARLLRPFRFSPNSFRDLHLLLQLKNTRHIYTVPANFRNYFHFQHPQTFTRSSLRTKNPKQKMKNWLQNIWNSFFPSWLCKKWGWGRKCRLTGWNQWAKCETTHPQKKPAEVMFWNMHQILFLVLKILHDYQKFEGLL